jgi:hypothetical protein
MKNLIQRVGDGIGRGIAVGLLGLTLAVIPAWADGNNKNKDADVLRALKMTEKIMDRVEDRLNEIYSRQEQSQDTSPYQEPQQDPSQLPQNQRHLFACNSVRGNQVNQVYPQDYSGIKSTFSINEPLMLFDYNPSDKKGDLWKLDIYGPKGDLVFENPTTGQPGIVPYDGAIMQTRVNDESNALTKYLAAKGGLGNYRAVFSLNGNEGEVDFTIAP